MARFQTSFLAFREVRCRLSGARPSAPQPSLHADGLSRALTQVALEVQKARRVSDVLAVSGARLEALGFDVAVLVLDGDGLELRHVSAPALAAALDLSKAGELRLGPGWAPLADGRALVSDSLRTAGPHCVAPLLRVPPEQLEAVLKTHAAVVSLSVGGAPWGVVVYMRDGLSGADGAALEAFTLHLGAALDVAGAFEQLDRRNTELELVHQLAVAEPESDIGALTQRALAALCRITQSNAGTLHRFVEAEGVFDLVGEPYGYSGPALGRYRRFAPRSDMLRTAQAVDVREQPAYREVLGDHFRHVAVIPFGGEGRHVGLLSLARVVDEPYGDSDLYSSEVLGQQVMVQLERTRLYGDLKRSYDELARAQAELVRHERLAALGELAAVMAHEVRNPLGVIFNSLTTLKRLVRLEGDAEMLVDIVGEEADRLNRIVGDLLDFVRPYELSPRPTVVEALLAGATDAALQLLPRDTVRLIVEVPRALPTFQLDGQLLRQALVNLVVNAAQAMPRGGTVTVDAALEQRGGAPWLRLTVRDEGVGLTTAAAERLFHPFFTTKATGTGLGLAVVKRIIDAHHGEVSARPNEGAPGTTFEVLLPGGG